MKKIIKGNVGNKTIFILIKALNKAKRFLAVVGIIAILWGYVPWEHMQAQGDISLTNDGFIEPENSELKDNIFIDYPTTTDPNFDISQVQVHTEDVSKRSLSTKTFVKLDGTYELANYNTTIHYYDEGEYKNIDNSLEDLGSELINKKNAFKIKFPRASITIKNSSYHWTNIK